MINIAIINTKVKKVLVQKIRNIKKNKKFGILIIKIYIIYKPCLYSYL